MSGLELASGIIAVIHISAKVASLCADYGARVRSAKADIERIQGEVERLTKLFENAKVLLERGGSDRLTASHAMANAVNECAEELKKLEGVLEQGNGRKAMRQLGLRAMRWPLKTKAVDAITANLSRQRDAVALALNIDQTSLMLSLEQELRELKLGDLSRKGAQPTSTMPFDADPDFVPRPDIINWMSERIDQDTRRFALVGLGGVGKSQMAIHFCHHLRASNPDLIVFWVFAGTRRRFEGAYESIARNLQLPGLSNPAVDKLALVRDWLQNKTSGRWLMILDNADDSDVFCPKGKSPENGQSSIEEATNSSPYSSYLPKTGNGNILITSRSLDAAYRLTGNYRNAFQVPVMSEGQAVDLFRNKIDAESDDGDVRELLSVLDFLPLAISQAAAYINRRAHRMSVRNYLESFHANRAKRENLLNSDAGDLRRDDSASNAVVTTWQMTFDKIRADHRSASRLLSIMSLFGPQQIPDFALEYFCEDGHDLDEDLDVLSGHSLISRNSAKGTSDMHPLVQLCTRAWASSCGGLSRLKSRFYAMAKEVFGDAEEDLAVARALEPHVDFVLNERPLQATELHEWADFVSSVGQYMVLAGKITLAPSILKEVVAIRESTACDESDGLFLSRWVLGEAMHNASDFEEADRLRRANLELARRVYGPQHPYTLAAVALAAASACSLGKYLEAETLCRSVLKPMEMQQHRQLTGCVVTLVSSLNNRGLTEEAYYIVNEEIARLRNVDSVQSLGLSKCLVVLSDILLKMERYDDAHVVIRECETLRGNFGLHHPLVLDCKRREGYILIMQGHFEEALHLLQSILPLLNRIYGEKHNNTIASLAITAEAHVLLGNFTQGEELSWKCLRLATEKSEGYSRLVSDALQNLVTCLMRCGKPTEAMAACRGVSDLEDNPFEEGKRETPVKWRILEEILGPALTEHRRDAEAVEVWQQVAERNERALGPAAQKTFDAKRHLVWALLGINELDEAERLLRDCLAIQFAENDDRGRNVVIVLGDLGCTLGMSRKLDEADELGRKALQIAEEDWADDEDLVKWARNNLDITTHLRDSAVVGIESTAGESPRPSS